MATQRLQLGDYLLLDRLGGGPGSETFEALDRRDGRRVILRRATDGPAGAAALARECEVLSQVQHANLVRLIGGGEAEGWPYCVLAKEDGTTLDRLPAAWRAAMGQAALLALLLPLLEALGALHAAGFLHGDVAPRNILLRRDGTPLLLDLAAAVPLAGPAARAGLPAATPGFAAPERGDAGRQGPWSDLYALAAVAYWLIVGRPRGSHPSREETLCAVAAGDKRVSGAFLRALDRALATDPEARPRSAADWRAELIAAAAPPQPETPDLAQLTATLGEAQEIDLPALDEVPETALLSLAERAEVPGLWAPAPSAAAADRERGGRGGRRAAWLLLALLLAAAGAVAGWWGWTRYQGATKLVWLVDPAGGGDSRSLAEAIARAPAGATIRVRAGVYAESLTIERPVTLEPDGASEVMIRPPAGPCAVLGAAGGALRGLAFAGGTGEGPCLLVTGGAPELTGISLGPWSGDGLVIGGGARPLVRDNHLFDISGSAILVAGPGGGLIAANEIERTAKSAVKVGAGAAPSIEGNRILEAGQAGLLIDEGSAGSYNANEILSPLGTGIEVRGGAAPSVSANRIEAAGQAGLFIHQGAGGEYADNVILRSRLSGVVVAGGAAPSLEGNEIAEGAQHGLLLVEGAAGRYTANRIHDNKGHGLVLGGAAAAEVADNEVSGNRRPQTRRLGH